MSLTKRSLLQMILTLIPLSAGAALSDSFYIDLMARWGSSEEQILSNPSVRRGLVEDALATLDKSVEGTKTVLQMAPYSTSLNRVQWKTIGVSTNFVYDPVTIQMLNGHSDYALHLALHAATEAERMEYVGLIAAKVLSLNADNNTIADRNIKILRNLEIDNAHNELGYKNSNPTREQEEQARSRAIQDFSDRIAPAVNFGEIRYFYFIKSLTMNLIAMASSEPEKMLPALEGFLTALSSSRDFTRGKAFAALSASLRNWRPLGEPVGEVRDFIKNFVSTGQPEVMECRALFAP